MIIFKQAEAIQQYLEKARKAGTKIGFVPTMGALHHGHISLIISSKKQNGLTVCSVFVNPTQFNNPADFAKYPITIGTDIDLLEAAGCEVLFLPSVAEIYPHGTTADQQYDLGYLETVLEGKYRPGHFQGVCQVVHRLLGIVQPHHLYLGQKDYQQCMVLQRLTALLALDTRVVIGDTLRETDGLAMSSRNMRLDAVQRREAVAVWQTLQLVKTGLRPGPLHDLKAAAVRYLTMQGFKADYVEIATARELQLLEQWDGETPLVVLVAAFLGEIRLIDNLLLP